MLLQNTLVTSFEFWLGMLEMGIQFPTMFNGWGRTSIVALLDLRNLSGCSAALVATLTPSTRTQSIKEGIYSSSRERDGGSNPEGGKDF